MIYLVGIIFLTLYLYIYVFILHFCMTFMMLLNSQIYFLSLHLQRMITIHTPIHRVSSFSKCLFLGPYRTAHAEPMEF